MPSIFPELLSYSFFGPTVLRLLLGVFFIITALHHSRQKLTILSVWPSWTKYTMTLSVIIELAIGVLFIIGLYTQVVALIAIVYTLKMLILRGIHSTFAAWAPHTTLLYVAILMVSLSILVLGAGALAFDFPL